MTEKVVTVKFNEVLPAGTVTVAGTLALLALLLNKLTTKPPLGATAVSVIVPVDPLPPRTDVGLRVNDDSAAGAAGFTVKAADFVTPLYVAEIFPMVVEVTETVVTGKLTEVADAGTVTELGTIAARFVLDKFTETPPAGAAAVKWTVPDVAWPPFTVDGLTLTDDNATEPTVGL